MEEYQALLDSAVGTAPPSTVDLDGVVQAGRRGARRRAAGMLSGTAVLVAGLLLGVAMLSGGRLAGAGPARSADPAVLAPGGGGPAASAPTSPGPTSPVPPVSATAPRAADSTGALPVTVFDGRRLPLPVLAGPVPPGRQPSEVARRLSQVLRLDLLKVAAEVTVHPLVDGSVALEFGTRWSGPLIARANLVGPAGAGAVVVLVGYTRSLTCASPGIAPPADKSGKCVIAAGTNGEVIFQYTEIGPGAPGVEAYTVVVQRRDGTSVAASAIRGPKDGSLAPPLTLAQLTALALDQGLTPLEPPPGRTPEQPGAGGGQ